MRKIEINLKVFESLGLTANEKLVFDALMSYSMSTSVQRLMKLSGLPRSTVRGIVIKLEERKLAERTLWGKRYRWKFNRNFEKVRAFDPKYQPGSVSAENANQ